MELSTTTWALIAIISALGVVGVVAVDTIEIVQDAEAGCKSSIPFNASKGRCFR
jgi:predicted transcriptional regulator